jgi:transcriptional regulator with XRE-family HTH domain
MKEVIGMLPEIDYYKIGQRVKSARLAKGWTQSKLGSLVDCSNNHMSHIEIGQTKVSLSLLLKLSNALGTGLDYFLLDTPYARSESIIDEEIAKKLDKCEPETLIAVNKMLDILLEQQRNLLLSKD